MTFMYIQHEIHPITNAIMNCVSVIWFPSIWRIWDYYPNMSQCGGFGLGGKEGNAQTPETVRVQP